MSEPDPELESWVARFFEENSEANEGAEDGDVDAFLARHRDAPAGLRSALQQVRATAALFPATSEPKSRLGPYRLGEELGRGGAARVFRAFHDARPAEAVALKILDSSALIDARSLARFQRECEILRGLRHANLARVVDAGEVGGLPYLALEMHEGGSLATHLEAARAQLPEAPAGTPRCELCKLPGRPAGARGLAALVADVAAAVQALHELGIVHRDLKPANVVIDRDGAPVLVDFGLAARLDRSTLSRTGDLLGTLPYMAPESARGERSGRASDVWGLGAILHELLTLAPPRQGAEPIEVLRAAQRRPVARIASLDPAAPRELAAIAERALAFRPARRFASAAALERELRAFAEGGAPRVRAPSPLERLVDRVRPLPAAIAALCVAALVTSLWFAAQRSGDDPEAAARLERIAREKEERTETAMLLAALGLADWKDADGRSRLEAPPPEQLERSRARLAELTARGAPLPTDRSIATLRGAVAAAPDDPAPSVLLALAALREDDDELAMRELQSALRVLPQSPELAVALARLMERSGRRRFEAGDHAGAARLAEQAIALDPLDEEAWKLLAIARSRTNDAAGAVAAASRLLELPLETAARERALRTYAVALDAAGMRETGLEILKGVVERAPDYKGARVSYGRMLDSECRLAEASEQYRAAIALDPGDADALGLLTHLYAGSNREKCDRCRRAFEERPELHDPDRVEALAVQFLQSTRGDHPALSFMVGRARDVGRVESVRRELDALIETTRDDRTLGGLVRARKLLPPP